MAWDIMTRALAGAMSVIIVVVPGPDGPQSDSPQTRASGPAGGADTPQPGSAADAPADGPSRLVAQGVVGSAQRLAGVLGDGLSGTSSGAFGLDRAEVLAEPDAPGGQLLRVSYPAGSASPQAARTSGGPQGGAQAYLRIGKPADDLTLGFWVRFPARFDFVKGGKLPGLFGGSGGSGGQHHEDGFSTRFMWRAGGAGEVYAYLPGSTGYGTSLGRGTWKFEPGRWHHLAQHVALNTPGQNNGVLEVWLDDQQVFTQNDLALRANDQLHIDGLFFSTFFGGGDTSWASPTDQYADFAGFTLRPTQQLGP